MKRLKPIFVRREVDLGQACLLASRCTENESMKLALEECARRLEGQMFLLVRMRTDAERKRA